MAADCGEDIAIGTDFGSSLPLTSSISKDLTDCQVHVK